MLLAYSCGELPVNRPARCASLLFLWLPRKLAQKGAAYRDAVPPKIRNFYQLSWWIH